MNDPEKSYSSGISIDKDGIWYYCGAEMFRKDIVNYLSRHLCVDENGKYSVLLPNDTAFIDVEDTALVVRRIDYLSDPVTSNVKILITLSDESVEEMDPATIRIGDQNIPYCRVRGNTIDARFNRSSYYQLAELISFEEGQGYYLPLNGHKYFFTFKTSMEALDAR